MKATGGRSEVERELGTVYPYCRQVSKSCQKKLATGMDNKMGSLESIASKRGVISLAGKARKSGAERRMGDPDVLGRWSFGFLGGKKVRVAVMGVSPHSQTDKKRWG